MMVTLKTTLLGGMLALATTANTALAQNADTGAAPAYDFISGFGIDGDLARPGPAEHTVGDKAAPVSIIGYASFTCPHCAAFHIETLPQLKLEAIDTGTASFTMRDMAFDAPGLFAAAIGSCLPQASYPAYVDEIFATQRDWISDDHELLKANLTGIGEKHGLDPPDAEACLSDEARLEALLDGHQARLAAHPIKGTPAFYINGTHYPNTHTEGLLFAVQQELDKLSNKDQVQ